MKVTQTITAPAGEAFAEGAETGLIGQRPLVRIPPDMRACWGEVTDTRRVDQHNIEVTIEVPDELAQILRSDPA